MARKILLADDSVTAQNMGRKILADAGYEVITVNNGSAALKKIGEQRPDVIVLDVYMPGYSGLEVCQRLKEVNETSRIPILLTVGKLEPFKPEEVKRVRADAFIVKPFEASELLSALSKLEDRIVPRSEPSKPGRFARATAAIDEARFDRGQIFDEDSGWRERIRFPSSKKEKEKEPEPEESAAFKPASKDSRSVIEHKIAEAPRAEAFRNGKPEERVDLGALAPVGLPKDVTPEEIAALAAAAAQMQGKIAESKIPESEPATIASAAVEVAKPESEVAKLESREEVRPEPKPEVPTPAATLVEPKTDEQVEAKPAEIPAAVSTALSDSHASSPVADSPEAAEEPVTMAVGGSSPEMLPAPSRWTGVSVALAPEDAAVSLEQEMQKACAAFAAAETGHAASATGLGESGSAAPPSSPTPVESVSSEPVLPVPASPALEEAQLLSAVASADSTPMSAAAEQVEAVPASYVEQKETTPVVPIEPPSTAIEAVPEQKIESVPFQAESAPENRAKIEDEPQPVTSESRAEEAKDNAVPPELPALPEISIPPAEPSIAQSAEIAPAAPPQPAEEPVRNEPDIAANAAAAWANWRGSNDSSVEPEAAQELAAKAVAAGAESNPADVTIDTGSDPAIASIVDSVLADLRPKIVEEISRKFGKKK